MNATLAGVPPEDGTTAGPRLPEARGPLSSGVQEALAREPRRSMLPPMDEVACADPFGADLQLALYVCYELHYRGFAGVDAGWEWDPELLRLRGAMERCFHAAVLDEVPGGTDVAGELDALLVEPLHPSGISHHLKRQGTWLQMREFFVHRSIYHLKEADPHAWVIPRLEGRAKASLVAVEFDEFGGGHADRLHAKLFADLMTGAGLDPTYGAYVDAVPAAALAPVNLMSYFGLHRALRGALVGHFTAAEITTAPSAARMVQALDRMRADAACRHFYAEHIEADAVHEQVMRRDVVGGLLADEPSLARDVVLGVQATGLLEERLEREVLSAWEEGRSSLLRPLPTGGSS
ncbi:iron-containing redox enzyme family protein [Streptomyces sp. NPDC047108]|uniref:iron-containing redox enzyme family protein n=1 Tax=Streptomyces sp. NPDC047108 TaxID=3155025 RepID=UPI0033CA7791